MTGLDASQALLNSAEYSALQSYLSSKSSIDKAQDAFCENIENEYMANQNPSSVEEKLWQAWKSAIALATEPKTSDHQRQKLADLVVALQRRPTLVKGEQTCEVHGMILWRDLPILGWQLRDAWNFVAEDNDPSHTQSQWINLNTFTAMLLASAHTSSLGSLDESLFCIWTARMVLEETDFPSQVSLAALSGWFIHASPALWSLCQQGRSFDGKVAAPGKLFRSMDWRGFTTERWSIWTQRLESCYVVTQSEVAKEKVEKAVETMKRASEKVR